MYLLSIYISSSILTWPNASECEYVNFSLQFLKPPCKLLFWSSMTCLNFSLPPKHLPREHFLVNCRYFFFLHTVFLFSRFFFIQFWGLPKKNFCMLSIAWIMYMYIHSCKSLVMSFFVRYSRKGRVLLALCSVLFPTFTQIHFVPEKRLWIATIWKNSRHL